jgi:hypothetical protein
MEQTSLKRSLEGANQDAPARTGRPTKQAKISTFFARAADPSPPKRPCVEQSTNALIYEWTLNLIDPEHPLFGTPYIGQVVRTGLTCQKMFDLRKREHINDARREPKDLGLHWAIRVFGEGAFTVRMVETTRLPRVQAMEWANEREIALIAEHGGVMRDCEPSKPMRQTFNLTPGGQGDPHRVWKGLEAYSRKKLNKVWPKLKAYHEEHGHLRVPQSDPDLGRIVNGIRSQNGFLSHADFKAWLDERDFDYGHTRRAHLEEDVWPKLRVYHEEHGHLRVPQSDPVLGTIVNNIRGSKCFLSHEDFKVWLDEHGFVYDPRRAHLEEEVWPKFKAFYEAHEHLRVPRSNPDLGTIVHHIRTRNDYLSHADFKAWLYERGFKMHARDATKNAERWAAVNGAPPVPRG